MQYFAANLSPPRDRLFFSGRFAPPMGGEVRLRSDARRLGRPRTADRPGICVPRHTERAAVRGGDASRQGAPALSPEGQRRAAVPRASILAPTRKGAYRFCSFAKTAWN